MRAMQRTIALAPLLAAAVAIGLGGCGGVKRQLGLTKQAPDEFRVVKRAPLSLPPDFELRPPTPGAERPQEGTARDQARKVVFRNTEEKSSGPEASPADGRSRGERALLARAGVDEANPQIRQIVNRETRQISEESRNFFDRLIFWQQQPGPESVVDAEAEARRLRENAALGKDATEGETPTIERKKKGILEGIF